MTKTHLGTGAASTIAIVMLLSGVAARAAGEGPRGSGSPVRAALTVEVDRELARLDERLDLRTSPDGSEVWLGRLVAALERRLSEQTETREVPGGLLRDLAIELQRSAGVSRGTSRHPFERLLRVLETVHGKLDAIESGGRAEADVGAGVHRTAAQAPGNDACSAAAVLGAAEIRATTVGASPDGTASCAGASPDVWYRFTADVATTYVFYTSQSTYDPVLSVHTGCPDDAMDEEVACSDDGGYRLEAQVGLDLESGEEVWVRVGGFAGEAGDFDLRVLATGTLRGLVTRAGTGDPVGGATVEIFDGGGNPTASTTTASDGTYEVSGLVGDAYVIVRAEGYVTQRHGGPACGYQITCDPWGGTPIDVSPGVTEGIDVALTLAGRITGSIVAESTGNPLAGFVQLLREPGPSSVLFREVEPDGTFDLAGLPPGKYFVKASKFGYATEVYDDLLCDPSCDPALGSRLVVEGGDTVSGVDLLLREYGDLMGTVTREGSGVPIEGALVVAYHPVNPFNVWTDTTGSDGAYRIEGVGPEPHRVSAEKPGYRTEYFDDIPCTEISCPLGDSVEVPLAGTSSGVDFSLQPLGTVSGTVTDRLTGAPLEQALVDLVPDPVGSVALTSAAGAYTISGVPSGAYEVRVRKHGYRSELFDDHPCPAGGDCDAVDGDQVAVAPDGAVEGVDFALDRLGRLQGHVSAADTGAPMWVEIRLFDTAGEIAYVDESVAGEFDLQAIPPGTYWVQASTGSLEPDYQSELWDDVPCEPTCLLSHGTAIDIPLNGGALGVDFRLAPCRYDSYTHVDGLTVYGFQEIAACVSVAAEDLTVAAGGNVTLRAGERVSLGDGFRVVDGGSFRVVIEPSLAAD